MSKFSIGYFEMYKLITALLFASITLSSCATYKTKIMEPWLGAPKEELVEKWGYPQSANDVVKIDDKTTVYTYRSYTPGYGAYGPTQCAVSFTIKTETVVAYKYTGADCPRYER